MASSVGRWSKRALIFVHRWLGVAFCIAFLLWFPSGFVMMYWGFPSVGAPERLERSPALDAARIRLSPAEAAARVGASPDEPVRLNTFDGRPVYRFGTPRDESIVYADTGDEQIQVSLEMVNRIASAWTGKPSEAALVRQLDDVDQWTVQTAFRNVKPLWKFSWPDGNEVYVSQATGQVIQHTTTASRWGAYLGAIPHWFYFTPLRKHGPRWSQVVIWSSGIGTISAILGVVVGLWMYSPSRRYRRAGARTGIPYSGWKRWHTIVGLIFGAGAVTWAFSGMLSMDPLPSQATGTPRETRRVVRALEGRPELEAYSARPPGEALAQLNRLSVKQLELVSFAGEPVYLATLAGGGTRIVPLTGGPLEAFDTRRIMTVVADAARTVGGARSTVIDRYDRYYLDRNRELPLPVVLVELNDGERTRYYIDPRTARVVGSYSARNWIDRWLYHGLHSLDFPWLYEHRPAWDIVVIGFMAGGTALSLTSLVLAWQVLGRKLRRNRAEEIRDAEVLLTS